MENTPQETGKTFTVPDVIDYISSSVVIKTILKKNTGMVTVSSFDKGEILSKPSSPFETLIQVIEGTAEVMIDDESHKVSAGQAIVVPAHEPALIKAEERFKIITTVIKSGYESF